jgi:hypothetical protein
MRNDLVNSHGPGVVRMWVDDTMHSVAVSESTHTGHGATADAVIELNPATNTGTTMNIAAKRHATRNR